MSAGGAVVLESRRESALHSLDDTTAWTICMDRAPLEPLLAGISDPIQRCLPADNPGMRLLQAISRRCSRSIRIATSTLATTHIRDLALCALGVRGDVQALVRERGVQAARQSAVLDRDRQARRRAGPRSGARGGSSSACRCATCTGCWSRPGGGSPSIFCNAGSIAPPRCCAIRTARI